MPIERKDIGRACVYLDKGCDFIPGISTLTAVVSGVEKLLFQHMPSCRKSNEATQPYIHHIKTKENHRFWGFIPVIGNLIVAAIFAYRKYKESTTQPAEDEIDKFADLLSNSEGILSREEWKNLRTSEKTNLEVSSRKQIPMDSHKLWEQQNQLENLGNRLLTTTRKLVLNNPYSNVGYADSPPLLMKVFLGAAINFLLSNNLATKTLTKTPYLSLLSLFPKTALQAPQKRQQLIDDLTQLLQNDHSVEEIIGLLSKQPAISIDHLHTLHQQVDAVEQTPEFTTLLQKKLTIEAIRCFLRADMKIQGTHFEIGLKKLQIAAQVITTLEELIDQRPVELSSTADTHEKLYKSILAKITEKEFAGTNCSLNKLSRFFGPTGDLKVGEAQNINVTLTGHTILATSAPMATAKEKDDRKEFFDLVMKQGVHKIISLVTPRRDKYLDYVPQNIGETISVEPYTIRLITSEVSDCNAASTTLSTEYIVTRYLHITNTETYETRIITQYNYKNFQDKSFPCDTKQFNSFVKMSSKFPNSLVHCKMGVGRTGLYIMASNKNASIIDLLNMKAQRDGEMVQTPEQLAWLLTKLCLEKNNWGNNVQLELKKMAWFGRERPRPNLDVHLLKQESGEIQQVADDSNSLHPDIEACCDDYTSILEQSIEVLKKYNCTYEKFKAAVASEKKRPNNLLESRGLGKLQAHHIFHDEPALVEQLLTQVAS
jgi:hypothetical protein